MFWSSSDIFWIVIGVIVVASAISGYFQRASRDKTIRTLAEKGLPVPEQLAEESRSSPARAGIILMCIGIGVGILLWAMTSAQFNGPIHGSGADWLPFVGVIPFMIGMGLLLSSGLGGSRRDR